MRIALLALGPFAVAGCGASDEERVREATTAFLRAYVAKDHAAVCRQVTPEARRLLAREASARSCEAAIADAREAISPRELTTLRAARIRDVRVRGERAAVTIDPAPGDPTATLRRIGDEWLLEFED